MKLVTGLAALALLGAATAARGQQNSPQSLPPEKEPPALVPLPSPPPGTRTRAIRVRNQPASFLAWQLDPEHNPPPSGLLAQLGRDPKAGAGASTTPTLDGIVKARPNIEIKARWVQIDEETLAKALPQWSELGATNWTRALPAAERETIETLVAQGAIVPLLQQFSVFAGQPTILSYLPFRTIIEPSLREVPRVPKVSAPDENSVFADPPYIPNIAETVPMLPYMAPMPGAGLADDFGLTPKFSAANPYSPDARVVRGGVEQMLGSRFQITPNAQANGEFTLILQKLDGLPRSVSARVAAGQTAVFSLPGIPSVNDGKVRRTFLLVEPREALFIPFAPPTRFIAPPEKMGRLERLKPPPISPAEIPRLPTP